MKIKPNASSTELTSPFFKRNEVFCQEFEAFITKYNGKVKGNYNVWSYLILGQISEPKKWNLIYKKSTFTSSGNLWFSSKDQSLLIVAEWTTQRIDTQNSEFEIRKKRITDLLQLKLNNKTATLPISEKYIYKSNGTKPALITKLENILKGLFQSEEVYRITYKNNLLSIELRSEKHHFNTFESLLEL